MSNINNLEKNKHDLLVSSLTSPNVLNNLGKSTKKKYLSNIENLINDSECLKIIEKLVRKNFI